MAMTSYAAISVHESWSLPRGSQREATVISCSFSEVYKSSDFPTEILQDYETKPITPPQKSQSRGFYQCVVDHKHKPFLITWSGSSDYPDLASFPDLKNVDVRGIPQSPNIATIWRQSSLLDYGSHASIRVSEHHPYPIIKLAHSSDLSLNLIQHEFCILSDLSDLGLPVAKFDRRPILDNGVVSGYQMQKLFKLEFSELSARADEIKKALNQLHTAGFCHGDFSPSNIMKDHDGNIIIIDLSFAGRLECAVPAYFPSWVSRNGTHSAELDLEAFHRHIAPI